MSEHFTHKELACQCCGINGMSPEFIEKLEALRKLLGEPVRLSSAYRCPKHNNEVSRTGFDGPHTTGEAVDIKCSGYAAHRVLSTAFLMGFTGIGVSQKGPHGSRFIHIDTLSGKLRPWCWSY